MDLFDFLTCGFKKVKRTEGTHFVVDTAYVEDSMNPYETAVKSPLYNDGNFIVVEGYANLEDSIEGHERWVKIFSDTPNKWPDEIKDAGSFAAALNLRAFYPNHMIYKKDMSKLN